MVKIDQAKCIGCGKCVRDCIAHSLKLKDQKANATRDCILCGHCVAICPEHAVSITDYDMSDVEEYDASSFNLQPEHVLHSIKFRRSIRDYKQTPVEQEKLNLLLQAGRYTATAKNNQGSYFVFVQEELETLKHYVWDYIDHIEKEWEKPLPKEVLPFVSFNRHRKADKTDDFLFRNAPVVLFITSDWPLDAGLAAQNIETMAVSLGLGALYNGYLTTIADKNEALKNWLGIEGKTIKACLLLGYPSVSYERTAPRKYANVIWK